MLKGLKAICSTVSTQLELQTSLYLSASPPQLCQNAACWSLSSIVNEIIIISHFTTILFNLFILSDSSLRRIDCLNISLNWSRSRSVITSVVLAVHFPLQAVRGEAGQPAAENAESYRVVPSDSGQPQPRDGIGQTLPHPQAGPQPVR